jgi:hypothetical protein
MAAKNVHASAVIGSRAAQSPRGAEAAYARVFRALLGKVRKTVSQ